MSEQLHIFIPATNLEVFHEKERPLGGLQIRLDVIEWLKLSSFPYYICRRDCVSDWRGEAVGQTFYFSKQSAAAMFKLRWG